MTRDWKDWRNRLKGCNEMRVHLQRGLTTNRIHARVSRFLARNRLVSKLDHLGYTGQHFLATLNATNATTIRAEGGSTRLCYRFTTRCCGSVIEVIVQKPIGGRDGGTEENREKRIRSSSHWLSVSLH